MNCLTQCQVIQYYWTMFTVGEVKWLCSIVHMETLEPISVTELSEPLNHTKWPSNVKVYRTKVYCIYVYSFNGTTVDDCIEGDVRLIDGTHASNGRVEVCKNGIWGAICSKSWSLNNARVLCLTLNYTTTGI